jgi:hypothetical protein
MANHLNHTSMISINYVINRFFFILFLNGNLTGGDTVVNVCFEALFHNAFKRFCHNLVSNFVWQQWIWICVTTMNLFVCDNNVFVRVWQQCICSCVTTMYLFVCDNNEFVRVWQQWICSCVTTMYLNVFTFVVIVPFPLQAILSFLLDIVVLSALICKIMINCP